MSRSADEGKDNGYNRNNRRGNGRWNRGRNYNYYYHKNELDHHHHQSYLNRPRSTSPVDHPLYPSYNNSQIPNNAYHGAHQSQFNRHQKNISGFRRNFDHGDGQPRFAYQSRNYSRYERDHMPEGQQDYLGQRDYFPQRHWSGRRSGAPDGFNTARDWHTEGQGSYPKADFQSSPEHHSASYESADSDVRETSDYSNAEEQTSKLPKSPSRRKRQGKKPLEKKQNAEMVTPQPTGTPSSVTSGNLDATVQQLQSQVQLLQQLSQFGMLVPPPMVQSMGNPPLFPMIPGYQPQAPCTSCHLGGVDLMRQLTLGTGFSPSASSIQSLPQAALYPTQGQESQDILAMLHQSGDISQLQCPECQSTSGCSCPIDEPTSLPPHAGDECGSTRAALNSLPDLTSSPKRLSHSPLRAVPSPIRKHLGPHQSPISSILAHLNETALSALQLQSPDRSSSRDDKFDNLPPIGVFWDIENCCVPSGKSAFEVVRRIRDRFFEGHREAEFMCVCDIKKENSAVIEELNDAQVTVAHINAVAKNAADDKLKQSLRRFADTHSRPATVVLISGDINFARDLSDLRHRHGLNVILVHKSDSSEALKSCANSTVKYADLITDLPFRSPSKHQSINESNHLVIHNLPTKRPVSSIRVRLEQLSDNCGGKVISLSNSTAIIKFPSHESAFRAKKRLEGENVFGNLISAAFQRCNGSYGSSPKTYNNKDNRKRGSGLDENLRNSPCHDEDAQRDGGEDVVSMLSPRQIPEESQPQERANYKRDMDRNASPPSVMTAFQKKIPNWTSLPPSQFRPLQERSYSPYSMNNSHDIRYRRSPAGDAGCFRSIPSVQRVTPPLNQTLFLPDGGISPLPMKGTYRAPTPIQVAANQTKCQWEPPPGVDLLVTNLDNKMTRKELKRLLSAAIGKHALVLHMKLFAPTQGHFQATVRVPTQADAMKTLRHVNGAQIGAWKIEILPLPASDSNADKLRQMVIPLLQTNGSSMPLADFKKAFQQKYDQVVYTFDLYQIPETVTLRESSAGKVISLSNQSRPETPNVSCYLSNSSRQSPMIPTRDSTPQPCARWCPIHIKDISKVVVEECVDINISVSLRTFSAQVLTLLNMHNGSISLASFPVCYNAEYSLTKTDNGVPLEHLISCIKGVFIMTGHDTYKYICLLTNKKQQAEEGNKAPPLLPQPLHNFSREVMELLKYSPLCKVDYHKFATEYHHKFNKQCRVADYGFLKLSELFDAITQSVQVLGEDDNKVITLSHPMQMRRFAQDALKVLRSQASKQVTAREFPMAFHRMFGRSFVPAEYGLCNLLDLISELPESQLVVEGQGDDTALSIPKREQTYEELIKCKKFGREVVELLSQEAHHSISFRQFIPTYHRYFNRQCKVGEYGVNKLIDLFEALPDIVKISDDSDKKIVLSDAERLANLCQKVNSFLPQSRDQAMPTAEVAPKFMKCFGWSPNWQELGLRNCRHLLSKFPHVMEIFKDCNSERVFSVEHQHLSQLTHQVLVVLLETEDGRLRVSEFSSRYQSIWKVPLSPTEYGYSQLVLLLKALYYVVMVRDEWSEDCEVELTPTYQFARRASMVLKKSTQRTLALEQFSQQYHSMYGKKLVPSDFDHTTLQSLISAVPWVLSLIGKGNRCLVSLNELLPSQVSSAGGAGAKMITRDIGADSAIVMIGQVTGVLPTSPTRQISSDGSTNSSSDLMKPSPKKLSPTELLCETSPSDIPSSILEPVCAPLPIRDLISFESPRATPDQQQQKHLLDSSFSSSPSPYVRDGSTSTSQDQPASSLPSSVNQSLSQREDFADFSSLPSSSLSSPLRSPTRSRSRSQVKLAANFQSSPLSKT